MNPTQEKEKDLITNPLATKVQPSVSANDLASPVTVPTMTQPQVGTLPTSPVVNNVAKETGNIIAAKTAEADDLAKLRKEYGALSQQGSLTDLFNEQLQQGGVTDESFRELKDINLQLADRGTASDLTKTQIQGAAGQTLGQAQREVTQEDREAAVRDAGLAARAAVLQGSIEAAQAAANQAVNIAFQDRQLTNTNLINQINDLSGVVDDQTQQLLDQKKQQYEADQAKIKELKDNIANAMVSGASQAEINRLTDPTTTDEDKLALAQSITARGATELRGLDVASKQASIRASNANAALNEQKLVDEIAKQTMIEDAIANGQVVLDPDQADRAAKIAKEFENESAEFKKQVNAYNRIVASVEDPSAAGDLALIFNYMKMLDPGSVVRESEFATAQNAAGVPDRLRAQYNNVLRGEKLAEQQRNDFFDRSTKLYNTGLDQQINLENRFRDQATDLYGLPENAADLIVQDIRSQGAVSDTAIGFTIQQLTPEQEQELLDAQLIQ